MNDQIPALAKAFAAILKEWASPEEWTTMRRANAAETDPTICASHDFCDANEAMAEAFTKLGLTAPGDEGCEDGSPAFEETCGLWNAAWALAKKEDLTASGWEKEFPDFPASDIPAIPEGFEDVSWHNDSCPSFLNEAAGLIIFVEREDPEEREFTEVTRFNLCGWDQGTAELLLGSEDFEDILKALPGRPGINLPAVARSSYGVHYMRGGFMVVWVDENGLADLIDMGEGSGVPLSPEDPYPVFKTIGDARRRAEAAAWGARLGPLNLEYVLWCIDNNLPVVSADEQDPERTTTAERAWLDDFINRWTDAQAGEDAAFKEC